MATYRPPESAVALDPTSLGVTFHPRVQFSDLVRIQFVSAGSSRKRSDESVERAEGELQRLWGEFEAAEGRIILSTFAVNFPGGVAVTEKDQPRRLRRAFTDKRTNLKLHRFMDCPGEIPAAVVTAFSTGDALSVRAAEVLWPPSARVVLQLIHSAQSHLVSIIDAAHGKLPRLAEPKRTPTASAASGTVGTSEAAG